MEKEQKYQPILPAEGLHVMHLFYRIDHGQWEMLDASGKIAAKTAMAALVQEIRSQPGSQLLTLSILTPKADLGFMLLARDLQVLDDAAKRLGTVLGAEMLSAEYAYLSMTERSEYTTTEEEFAATLKADGLDEGSPEWEGRMIDFRSRMEKYGKHRLEPHLPDWPVFCFYPMSKRRQVGQNWYSLDFAERKRLMGGHARVGRQYSGRVLQLITGSTGLDDMEWGVTLFAHTTSDIKQIVYEMRFDPVSAEYAEFGNFFIGIQLPLDALFLRLGI